MIPPETEPTDFAPSGFAEEIGVEWIDFDPENARARIAVESRHLQPNGVVHGGVYASLAESLASAATYRAVKENGEIAFGMANDTSFLRVISEGHVNATARARQRGRTTWVWDVELSDDEGRVCALSRMTVAVRPRR
ncbi:MAG TPA: PaaI family thioesterase [Solirubrobacterales bacterium]|nr:PaaI family thioesterase [Solirubrobacterales bacterium]